MSIPQVGAYRTADHWYYMNGEGPKPGTTGIIRALDKPELFFWKGRETAASAIRNHDYLGDMIRRGGTDAAAAWLEKIPDYERDKAANLGNRIHSIAEQLVRAGDVPVSEEEAPFVKAYLDWRNTANPQKLRPEQMVFSDKGYAGTLDLLCELDGKVTLVDLKTGSGVYREVRLQLAAYGFADFIGRPGDPKRYALPKIERYAVLHLRPEQYATGYRLHEFEITDADYDAFLACLRLKAWRAGLNGKGN
jgi:hypothetical protein